MDTRETDFLKFEEEVQNTRKKLNSLIQEYHTGVSSSESQPAQADVHMALYQDKINFLETEMRYLNNQLQILKRMGPAQSGQTIQNSQSTPMPQVSQSIQVQSNQQVLHGMPVSPTPSGKPKEYEKMFGKSFMGIFASALIFISLIIFATLVLPYLNDTIKLIGLYVLSFGILGAGLLLYHKKKHNNFYIAVIGCGIGSLYLSLLLSNLYFKVLGDIALYCFVLVWAVLVKNLTRLKNLVFQIIGQVGIFIATVLGTVLCVGSGDEKKFLVLTVFYLLSSCVFSEIDKTYLKYLLHSRKDGETEQASVQPVFYENRFCSHISKFLNAVVFLIGFSGMEMSGFKITGIILIMLYLLLEYYMSFRETCRHGLAFQMLTVGNTFLMIGFFREMELLTGDYSNIFIYLAAIAVMVYVEVKNAQFKIYTLIWCAILAFVGCFSNRFIREHLYVYLTVIPFLLYGKWKNREMYRNTGIVYLGGLWMLVLPFYEYNGYRSIECFIMIAAVCAAFLYTCHKAEYVGVKISGYILLCLTLMEFVGDVAFTLMKNYNGSHIQGIEFISSKAKLITFFTLAAVHLLLSKLNYFRTKKPVEGMMFTINGLLMLAGSIFMHNRPWQIPTILITVLLFLLNSKKILSIHKMAGYYVVFKYTILMVSILTSFRAENYIISICLLLFAIASIVAGFYKEAASFRLYGLILSMISVIKLIMIDIHYDSTLENALSFFISGVLCFIISFIYHKIDTGFKKKENSET